MLLILTEVYSHTSDLLIRMFGFHVSKSSLFDNKIRSVHDAIEEDMEFLRSFTTTPCCQIFARGPQNFDKCFTEDEHNAIRRALHNVPCVIHGSYLDSPWTPSNHKRAIHNIQKELNVAQDIGATGVIIHLSKESGDLSTLSELLNEDKSRDKSQSLILWLEINCAKPTVNTFETPEKISLLFDTMCILQEGHQPTHDNSSGPRLGLCVDTAHLHACGVSLKTYNQAKQWFTRVYSDAKKKKIPIMIHLNDCTQPAGNGVDGHTSIGDGRIWEDYTCNESSSKKNKLPFTDSGAYYILKFVKKHNLMCILERKKGLLSDVTLINKWIGP